MWTGSLQWRHNDHDGVSNHQPHDCLLNRLFRRRSKKTSKLRVTGLCAGNSPVPGEFPAQRASTAENVSIWWRHHDPTVSQPHEGWAGWDNVGTDQVLIFNRAPGNIQGNLTGSLCRFKPNPGQAKFPGDLCCVVNAQLYIDNVCVSTHDIIQISLYRLSIDPAFFTSQCKDIIIYNCPEFLSQQLCKDHGG